LFVLFLVPYQTVLGSIKSRLSKMQMHSLQYSWLLRHRMRQNKP